MWLVFRLMMAALRTTTRSRQDLVLENVAPRHQLAVYRRSRRRAPLTDHDRQLWSTLAWSWARNLKEEETQAMRAPIVIAEGSLPDSPTPWA